ncbi:hypothetical protein E2P81_ATG05579 [Venturia nashicola]|uniref:Uncharacterized protein n=1 Tax=Venturia nashicola TaxID=86259 RepID=A0A4Z1P3M5_9PEZI|nr:hypothetical protein E6O75_ATG05714 [Venturia nashicola]TLD32603.1 hypothetical protein E2P81_ATG05579 [Venturia nashicola]
MYHPVPNSNATPSIELGPVSPVSAPHTPRPSLDTTGQASAPPSRASSSQPNTSQPTGSIFAGIASNTVTPTTSQSNTSAAVFPATPRSASPTLQQLRGSWISSSWWWWEIGAALLSMTSMLLIIVVLVKVQDKPLGDWHFSIQPNSLIAVLTTVGKTAMLLAVAESISQLKWLYFDRTQPLVRFQEFDEATRGPWGAFVLICGTRGKAILACLGAFITIVALGIEPTAQQILDFPTRIEPVYNLTATLGKADVYYTSGLRSTGTTNVVANNPDLLRFQTAIVNGIVGRVSVPDFECPQEADSCHWSPFTTLGVCGQCEKVTDSVTYNCSQPFRASGTILCDYDVPGVSSSDVSGPGFHMMYDPQLAEPYNSSMLFKSFGSDGSQGIITIKIPSDAIIGVSKNATANAPPYEIEHCTIDWCARSFPNVTAVPGRIERNESTFEYLTAVRGIQDNLGTEVLELRANSTGMKFNVTRQSYNVMWGFITGLVNNATKIKQISIKRTDTSGSVLDFGGYLYNSNISKVIDDIAVTVTNQIRSQSQDNLNATMMQGEVRVKETYVKVRWPWLILPLLETILATILLISSIIMNGKTPLWKSSMVACLVHGLDGWNDDELIVQGHESVGSLNRLAQGMKVTLTENDEGFLKLKRT